MRRLGDTPLSGAERTRRWRQRRWQRQVAEAVEGDLAQLPEGVDPRIAAPIVRAWRGRGLRYPITDRQWSVVRDVRPGQVDQLAAAVREAPKAGPVALVWRAVMERVQDARATVLRAVQVMAPKLVAHALRDRAPDSCATCGRPPSVRYHDGTYGFPCSHSPIRQTALPAPAPQYPPEDSPGMRAWRAAGEMLRKYPKA